MVGLKLFNIFSNFLILGLDVPITRNFNMTRDEIKQKEDDLTAYFLHEMRKKPVPPTPAKE
jgi:hypothetical protein